MIDVELPKLAETQVQCIITRWVRHTGERVREGEPLVEVETDKVNSELEAPVDGVLVEVLADEGARVPVGQVIARIEPSS
jgi:pyruvate/2-oxoglutarate dehydrogenase complex dihydrolipoamide acyltransferase (E2) component